MPLIGLPSVTARCMTAPALRYRFDDIFPTLDVASANLFCSSLLGLLRNHKVRRVGCKHEEGGKRKSGKLIHRS